jgi:serine/threonine protein kinase
MPFERSRNELEQMANIVTQVGFPAVRRIPSVDRLPNWKTWQPILEKRQQRNTFMQDLADYPGAFDLVSRMLDPDPRARPTIYEAIDHPLFTGGYLRDPMSLGVSARDYVYQVVIGSRIDNRIVSIGDGGRVGPVSAISALRMLQYPRQAENAKFQNPAIQVGSLTISSRACHVDS